MTVYLHISYLPMYIQYDKYEDQKGTQDSDMDTQALLVWPTLHRIAEPFNLQADTLGVHLRWADDVYTVFFPEFVPERGVVTAPSRPTSHRERAKSMKVDSDDVKSDIADYLVAMTQQNGGQNRGQLPNPMAGLDLDTPPDMFAAAAERNKNKWGGNDTPSLGESSRSIHGFPGV